MNFEGKLVVVSGLGKSGLAAVALLRAQGARVRAMDESPTAAKAEALSPFGVELELQSEAVLEGAAFIVVSPGVPLDLPVFDAAKKKSIPIMGEVELAGYYLKGGIIGITGSNGKTTTTALTGHILREAGVDCQVGGNIGTPPTAMIESSREGRWNVLELSSFQLETIHRFHAGIAVALNVTSNHLDRHHTFAAYAAAKARLFETQRADGFAVLNADNAVCVSYAEKTKANVKWFSLSRPFPSGACLENGHILVDGQPLLPAAEVPLRGRHNLENVMAAAIVSRLAGAAHEKIAAAVRTFPGVEHRLEFVRSLNGVDYFNDSKATSVDAALKAIDAFEGGLWIVLGGHDKNSDYTVMRDPLSRKARMALLIGEAVPIIERQLAGAVPMLDLGTLDAAVAEAHARAKPGDTVLLAPACSSYDQYQNFEERGRAFKRLVGEL